MVFSGDSNINLYFKVFYESYLLFFDFRRFVMRFDLFRGTLFSSKKYKKFYVILCESRSYNFQFQNEIFKFGLKHLNKNMNQQNQYKSNCPLLTKWNRSI